MCSERVSERSELLRPAYRRDRAVSLNGDGVHKRVADGRVDANRVWFDRSKLLKFPRRAHPPPCRGDHIAGRAHLAHRLSSRACTFRCAPALVPARSESHDVCRGRLSTRRCKSRFTQDHEILEIANQGRVEFPGFSGHPFAAACEPLRNCSGLTPPRWLWRRVRL
jgi:hypothetical protein